MDRETECDYWYCPRCKRMMECSLAKSVVERVYKPLRISDSDKNINMDLWREFYSYSDNELFVLTKKNFAKDYKMTLQEFYEKYPCKYFYRSSPDETRVFAYDTTTQKLAFIYGQEEWIPPNPDDLK